MKTGQNERPDGGIYTVRRAARPPRLDGAWDDDAWNGANEARIGCFRPESADHRPDARVRVLFDDAALYVRFEVADRFVRSVQTEFNGPVCSDSCVEFFFQPRPDRGYFNVEVNAGGTLLMSYVSDPGGPGRERRVERMPEGTDARLGIVHDLPVVVDPELTGPVTWHIGYRLPLDLVAPWVGPLGSPAGQEWRANFYKCGDRTSHPHWASWQPVDALNFHLPHCFGRLRFEP